MVFTVVFALEFVVRVDMDSLVGWNETHLGHRLETYLGVSSTPYEI